MVIYTQHKVKTDYRARYSDTNCCTHVNAVDSSAGYYFPDHNPCLHGSPWKGSFFQSGNTPSRPYFYGVALMLCPWGYGDIVSTRKTVSVGRCVR